MAMSNRFSSSLNGRSSKYLVAEENIEVRDILGKLIYSSEGTYRVQTSDWESGIYFIHLKNKKQTFKVVKI